MGIAAAQEDRSEGQNGTVPMFVLDSDHMSLLEWGSGESAVLRQEHLADVSAGKVVTTIICYWTR